VGWGWAVAILAVVLLLPIFIASTPAFLMTVAVGGLGWLAVKALIARFIGGGSSP
jgi:hypothetical protein